MNKQEAIEKIKSTLIHENTKRIGKAVNVYGVIDIIKQIDEPEKPVLSKEEAEWLEHLKSIGNFTHCLYVITRQGWGCDFEFRSHGKKYKLSCESKNDGDENELTKSRLVNALIYGYEVEKEKLYTVELPNPNGERPIALRKNEDGEIYIERFWCDGSEWINFYGTKLTENEIKKDFEWAWQFAEEVEE